MFKRSDSQNIRCCGRTGKNHLVVAMISHLLDQHTAHLSSHSPQTPVLSASRSHTSLIWQDMKAQFLKLLGPTPNSVLSSLHVATTTGSSSGKRSLKIFGSKSTNPPSTLPRSTAWRGHPTKSALFLQQHLLMALYPSPRVIQTAPGFQNASKAHIQ